MRHFCPFALLLLLGACSDDDDKFDCSLGELSGTWRTTYQEVDGNCGAIPAETTNFSSSGGSDPCKYALYETTPDKCRLDFDFVCPTLDGKGQQRWTGVTTQVEAEKLESDTTLQLQHPTLGSCRSTYKVTGTKL